MDSNTFNRLNSLGDYSLVALRWEDDGTTLEIQLRHELRQSHVEHTIVCRYFQNLRIDFDFGKLCDSPLMWGSSLNQGTDGYELTLDFRGNSNGVIRLEASEFIVR